MLSIRLNPQAEKELKEIAKFEGVSVSDYVRKIINEKLEDMYDMKLAEEAHMEYINDPETFSHDEVGKIYQSCDILLKTSILESFSYPPLEMMATGGIAVVAPNGGNKEYLRDEENCLLYELGNVDKAAQQIERISTDAELRNKLVEGGLKSAREREWSKIEQDIVDMYVNLEEKKSEY